MIWDYSGFLAEKVEAGRRLLASDPAWAGSEDLQAAVEDKDLTGALRHTFLLPSGEPRQGLTLHEKRQGLILFLLSARRKLEMRSCQLLYPGTMVRCLTDAARDVGLPRGACSTASAFQHLAPLAVVATILLCVPPDNKLFQSQLRDLCDAEWTDEDTALATALEAELRAAGHDPLLTAAEQQRLTLLLSSHAARMLEEVSLPPRLVARVRHAARRASRRLVQLHPGSAMLKQVHAFALSLDPSLGRQTTAAYRAALQAAKATNSHLLVAYAGYGTAFYMLHGAEGPTWPLAEVRSLLQLAARSFRLCKPWQFSDGSPLEQVKQLQRQVAAAAAARPGATQLPLIASLDSTSVPSGHPAPPCDACGQESPKLRRCAACQERAYCCRECQVADWKRGHKAECARLAAQRGSGGS